jgi:hypothetical protein
MAIHSQDCRPTIYAPLGFAMWRPMAEALGWPDSPVGWDTIVDLAADPAGWSSYGRPEWGQFRFGHSHPAYANSGLLAMTSFVHGIVGVDGPLTAAQVYEAEEAMRTLELNTSKYGRQSVRVCMPSIADHVMGKMERVTELKLGSWRHFQATLPRKNFRNKLTARFSIRHQRGVMICLHLVRKSATTKMSGPSFIT